MLPASHNNEDALAHDAFVDVVFVVKRRRRRRGHVRDAKQQLRGRPWWSPRSAAARGANQLFASAMTTLNTHDPPERVAL